MVQTGAPLSMLPRLMRLAAAAARLHLRPCVNEVDVLLAIKLTLDTMQSQAGPAASMKHGHTLWHCTRLSTQSSQSAQCWMQAFSMHVSSKPRGRPVLTSIVHALSAFILRIPARDDHEMHMCWLSVCLLRFCNHLGYHIVQPRYVRLISFWLQQGSI